MAIFTAALIILHFIAHSSAIAIRTPSLASFYDSPSNSSVARRREIGLPAFGWDFSYSQSPTDCADTVGTTMWADGQGKYKGSACDYEGCWTDYYVVGHMNWQKPYEKVAGDLHCGCTKSCSSEKMTEVQTCKTNTITSTTTISISIFDEAVAYSHAIQECNTSSDTITCQWADKKCHNVWSSQEMVRQLGYVRRSCRKSPNGEKSTRPDGYFTVSSKDWIIDYPTNLVNYGCEATCHATQYPITHKDGEIIFV